MFEKKTGAPVKETKVTDIAAAEAAMPEERHPATKEIMTRRAAGEASADLRVLLSRLLAAGGHDVHCPAASAEQSNCACAWGGVAAEARAALGDA